METNWLGLTPPKSAPDVFFLVKADDGENMEAHKVFLADISPVFKGMFKHGAHKVFLADISPVFKAMFFGPMKETGKMIEVKETFPEAFCNMINLLYKPAGEYFTPSDIKHSCPQKLLQLVIVTDFYEIVKLKTLALEAIRSLEITHENLLFYARVAKKYRDLTEEGSKMLSLRCLQFITKIDTLTLFSKTKMNFPEANFQDLHELMAGSLLPGVRNFEMHLIEGILQVGEGWSPLTWMTMCSQKNPPRRFFRLLKSHWPRSSFQNSGRSPLSSTLWTSARGNRKTYQGTS